MICKPCAFAADWKAKHAKCVGKLIHPSHCDCQCKNSKGEYIGIESGDHKETGRSIAFRVDRVDSVERH